MAATTALMPPAATTALMPPAATTFSWFCRWSLVLVIFLSNSLQKNSCTAAFFGCAFMMATIALMSRALTSLDISRSYAMFQRALYPCSWTAALFKCSFMAFTTASMPPAAATIGLVVAVAAMLRSALQPDSWTTALILIKCASALFKCAFIAATTASMPPSFATFSMFSSDSIAMLPSAAQPFSWISVFIGYFIMAATTASMPPSATTFRLVSPAFAVMPSTSHMVSSAFAAMLRSAPQPDFWMIALPKCAFMTATIALIPPAETRILIVFLGFSDESTIFCRK